ncbi:uncharacterized protein LOC128280436 [Gossypium arboreum]|uniref:uncharacterized protein LOC128280436 n=1 Tax=Gossypium arboreum TaxID=29729 RepID=UPI0022F154B5|nr:uncharacterized protein LOC128280436 [Gossypium arboreum]
MEHRIKNCPRMSVQVPGVGRGGVHPPRCGQLPPRGRGQARGGNDNGRMDWLVKYRATLDCAAKRMVLRTMEDKEVVVIGEHQNYLTNVISALRAEKLFEWTDKQQESFGKLKKVLTEAPVLIQPEPGKEFTIRSKQLVDETLGARFRQVENGTTSDFGINSEGVLCFRGRMCIPKDDDLRQSILRGAHSSLNAMHPGENKMYQNLYELYWWPGLKREVIEFVHNCLVC